MSIVLSRRERELLDILYRLGEATGEQVRAELTEAPHYSTVRALLRVLEQKGHILHVEQNLRYVYRPVVSKQEAAQLALDRLEATFFDGSRENLLRAVVSRMPFEQLEKARQILNETRETGSQRPRRNKRRSIG